MRSDGFLAPKDFSDYLTLQSFNYQRTDKNYSRNVSCTLNSIFTFIFIFTCLKILVWQLEKSIFYVMRSDWCYLSKKKTFMRHHMCDGIVTGYERAVITTGQSYNIVPQ
jgi:hypothetical protein